MKFYLFLMLAPIIFTACNSTAVYNKDQISQEDSDKIASSDRILFESLIDNKPEKVKIISVPELYKDSAAVIGIYKSIQGVLKLNTFQNKNLFFISNSIEKKVSTVFSEISEINGYTLSFESQKAQSIVSITEVETIEGKAIPNKFMLLTIYGKYNGNWKLHTMQLGASEIGNKTSMEWIESAKKRLAANDLVNASNEFYIGTQISAPLGSFLTYTKAKEALSFKEKLKTALAKYRFPMALQYDGHSFNIVAIQTNILQNAYYPCFLYVSQISPKDTRALSEECDILNKHIASVFPNINTKNDSITYVVFDKIPTQNDQAHHTFTKKTVE